LTKQTVKRSEKRRTAVKKLALISVLLLAAPAAMAQSTTPGQQPSPNAVIPGQGAQTAPGQEPSPNAVMPGQGAQTAPGQEPSPNTVNPNKDKKSGTK
jgi:hypothetical protein